MGFGFGVTTQQFTVNEKHPPSGANFNLDVIVSGLTKSPQKSLLDQESKEGGFTVRALYFL